MRRLTVLLGLLFFLFCTARSARANCCVWDYAPAFPCATLLVPRDFSTIQAAIDASLSPRQYDAINEIVVSPGIYRENIDYKGKSICITSTLSTDPAEQAKAAASTIIDGGATGPAVFSSLPYTNGFYTELTFFTIQNGGSPAQGGLPSSRAGIYSTYGIPGVILGNVIKNNNFGGIVLGFLSSYPYASSPLIENNTIEANTCWGILVVGGEAEVLGNEIEGTSAPAGECTYHDSAFGTTLTTNAAAISVQNSGPSSLPYVVIKHNTIENNVSSAVAGGPVTGGAGILVDGGYTIIEGNTLRNNTATAARGGAIDVESSSAISIVSNLIYSNQASCGGAAIALNSPNLRAEPVPNRQSATGFAGGYAAILANNTIADNTALADPSCKADAQISFSPSGISSPSILLINNVISNGVAGPAVSCVKQPAPSLGNQAVFDHNLLYNGGEPFFGGECSDEGTNPLLANIVADPQFISPTSGPLQLSAPLGKKAGSPGIDTGTNAALEIEYETIYGYIPVENSDQYLPLFTPYTEYSGAFAVDIVGHARLQNIKGTTDADGRSIDKIDMGAYESSGSSNPTNDSSMYMLPSSYPATAGEGTLAAYIQQNFTIGPPHSSSFEPYAAIYPVNIVAPSSGSITFLVDGQQAGPSLPISTVRDQFYLTAGYAFQPYCFDPGIHILSSTYQQAPGFTTAESQAVVVNIAPTPAGIYLSATPVAILEGAAVTFSVIASPFTCSTYIPSPLSLIDVNTNAVLGSITPDPATGTGSFTTTALHQGYNLIEASFAGNANYIASVSNTVLIDVQATTMLSVSSSQSTVYAYTPFTLTGQITPDPSSAQAESLAFTATPSGSNIEQALGAATLMPGPAGPGNATTGVAAVTASLGAGVYNIAANYAGDKNFAAGRSPSIVETVLANPTSITLRSGLNPAVAFQPIPLTAHVTSTTANVASGSITGTVSFLANGVPVGAGMVDANGNASATVTLAAGKYGLVASYAGNDSFAPSQSPSLAETVTADSSAITLAVTPNPGYAPGGQETLTAAVTAAASATVPTGTVTFQDNFNGTTVTAGSAVVSPTGQAILTTATLAVGIHRLTANYGGSNDFQPSLSSPVTLTILQRDFTLTTPPSITIQTMHHALLPVSLVSLGGFTDNIALSCANLPAYATCNFPQGASVNLGAGVTATTTIDLDTDALLNFASNRAPAARSRWLPFAALLLPAGWFTLRRRRSATNPTLRLLAALLALALPALLITACSGKQPGHTTPGTYSITLTGTGQTTNQTHTATFNLVVTP